MKSFLTLIAVFCCMLGYSQSSLYFDGGDSIRNSDQTVVDIVTDPAGNTYVTGYSNYLTSVKPEDIITIKYDVTGTKVWTAFYSGPGEKANKAVAIKLDQAGNIYVVGHCIRNVAPSDNNNFVVVKYSPLGEEVWSKVFDDNGSQDIPVGMEIDLLGNAYVVSQPKRLTKYSPTGDLLWSKLYTDSELNPGGIGMDASGLPYVFGTDTLGGGKNGLAIYKSDAAGNIIWKRKFDLGYANVMAGKMAMNDLGVYITGIRYLSNNVQVAALKYTLDGVYEWSKIDTVVTYQFEISAAAVGKTGDFYYSVDYGDSLLTRKLSNSGATIWQNLIKATPVDQAIKELILDSQDNAYLVGNSGGSHDFLLLKYNADGTQAFSKRYAENPNKNEEAVAISLLNDTSIFISGTSNAGYSSQGDYLTLALDSSGNTKWKARFDGLAHAWDWARASCKDNFGNFFVGGSSYKRMVQDPSFVVLKYDSTGTLLWNYSFDPTTSDAQVMTMNCDSLGNLYVAGSTSGATDNATTFKLSPNGQLLWTKNYSTGIAGDDAAARGLQVFGGSVYVAGQNIGSNTNNQIFLLKYDTTGNQLWTKTYNTNDYEMFHYLHVDKAENIFIIGTNSTANNFLVIRYDKDGNQIWAKKFNGGDEVRRFDTDGLGNLYLAGGSTTAADKETLIKIDSDGNVKWTKIHQGVWTQTLAVDSNGNAYHSLYTTHDDKSGLAITKYDSSGTVQWDKTFNIGTNARERAGDAIIDKAGNLWLAGFVQSATEYYHLRLKYDSSGNLLLRSKGSETIGRPEGTDWTFLQETGGKMYSISNVFNPNRGDLDIFLPSYKTCVTNSYLDITSCDSYELNGTTYTKSGVYTETLSNNQGCDSIIELNLTVFNPNSNVTSYKDSVYADGVADSYQWLSCDNAMTPISGATSRAYKGKHGRSYAVVMTSNSCSDTSSCRTFDGFGCYKKGRKYFYVCDTLIYNGKEYNKTGIYFDTVATNDLCDSIYELNINYFNPLTTITVEQNKLTADEKFAQSYEWLDCDSNMVSTKKTGTTFTAGKNGRRYAVRMKFDTCVVITPCVAYQNTVGLNEIAGNSFKIYPSPAREWLNIDELPSTGLVVLTDLTGKTLITEKVEAKSISIDISGLSSGMYLVKYLHEGQQSTIGRIIKADN